MSELYIGLMSGTSMDGIDAALVRIGRRTEVVAGLTSPYPEELSHRLRELIVSRPRVRMDDLGQLDVEIGECFARAALALLDSCGRDPATVAAIGSHGQTLRHRPDLDPPFTWQLGDPNVIAARTGITTVADFRRRDVALGGQGAPLVPPFHRAAFAQPGEDRVVINIGGIANLSFLSADGSVTGFDSGPGNTLMDAWCMQHKGESFDRDGEWAAQGTWNRPLLAALFDDEYFRRTAPKSTGREYFDLPWLAARLLALQDPPSEIDVQATLCELTAGSIAQAVAAASAAPALALVCGGGTYNRFLMARLAALLPDDVPVKSTEALGLAPEWVEAAAFAWLANRTLGGATGNCPGVTGAHSETVLGGIFPV